MKTFVRLVICAIAVLITVVIAIAAQEWLLGRAWQSITGVAGALVGFGAWHATRSLKIASVGAAARPAWAVPAWVGWPAVTVPGAIIALAAILALAVVFIGRWQVHLAPPNVVRLDRWTGAVALCEVSGSSPVMRCDASPALSFDDLIPADGVRTRTKPDDWVVPPSK
jgi:hypothetical protein